MSLQARWLTRDFVFTAPVAFPHVVALTLDYFVLRPSMEVSGATCLFVSTPAAMDYFDLDRAFPVMAADILQRNGPADWSIEPRQLLGRDARRGMACLSADGVTETAEVLLVRGRDDRPWVFARRSFAEDETLAARGFAAMLQSLQERPDGTDGRLLQSQFEGQDRKRQLLAEAGERPERELPRPLGPVWTQRLAAALAVDEAVAAPLIADAVALVEEPYGDPVPIGASRVGGGPDLPAGAWPTDARGMHHPFLLQIDFAEVAAACGPMPPLPDTGLLSFFVHDDALLVDIVYSPPGARLIRFPMTQEIIEASRVAVRLRDELPDDVAPGRLPHEEGDHVAAVLEADGRLSFSHSPDTVWAYGPAGLAFDALSDDRWACVASARLRPVRTRSIDIAAAQQQIEDSGGGVGEDPEDIQDDLRRAPVRMRSDIALPQIHGMLGHVTHDGWRDCRQEAAGFAEQEGHVDLTTPEDWMLLVHLQAGSATGREFWDALDLTIMAPVADVTARRWDRCIVLSG